VCERVAFGDRICLPRIYFGVLKLKLNKNIDLKGAGAPCLRQAGVQDDDIVLMLTALGFLYLYQRQLINILVNWLLWAFSEHFPNCHRQDWPA
jgi:hypothetical protein